MRDQKKILIKCLENDIPTFVISARDVNAVDTLTAYLESAKKNKCDIKFIADMEEVLNGFIIFSEDEPELMKKPIL